MGDFNVYCIASSEDVVTLKIGLAYRWWGVLTFIALRHEKMLLRLRSFSHTDGGWGAMLPFIALRHQEMLLR